MPIGSSSRTECCVGLVFSSPAAAMYGTQREMDVDRVLAADVLAELADRLEERQGLDVADRAADLDDDDVVVLGATLLHRSLDLVGDVRDHLDGRAEVVAAPLLGDDVLVDAAGRDVVRPARASGR